MRWIRDASIRTQIVFVLGSVAFITATVSWHLLHGAVPAAAQRGTGQLDMTISVIVGICAACTVVAAFFAGVWLDSSIGHTIGAMRSATDEIAAGNFRHRIGSRRNDELGRLAASIDAMASQLEQLEDARRQFIASVSHDLRTPLTVARGQAFTLARREDDPDRVERLQLIDTEIDRVATMVDDLLLAASLRVRPMQVVMRDVALDELVAGAAERFRQRAAERGVSVGVAIDARSCAARVDAGRLQQLLGNLLDNAIRHASPGSEVVLSVRSVRRARLRVAVTNVGEPVVGTLDEIAAPFRQGNGVCGAAGLGLSIARELVRAHGSDLQLRCEGGATTFSFDVEQGEESLRMVAGVARFAT